MTGTAVLGRAGPRTSFAPIHRQGPYYDVFLLLEVLDPFFSFLFLYLSVPTHNLFGSIAGESSATNISVSLRLSLLLLVKAHPPVEVGLLAARVK